MSRLRRQSNWLSLQRDDLRGLQRLFPSLGQSWKEIRLRVQQKMRDQPLEQALVLELSMGQMHRQWNEERMHHVRQRYQRKKESNWKEQSPPGRSATTGNGKTRSWIGQIGCWSVLWSVYSLATVQIQDFKKTTKLGKISLGEKTFCVKIKPCAANLYIWCGASLCALPFLAKLSWTKWSFDPQELRTHKQSELNFFEDFFLQPFLRSQIVFWKTTRWTSFYFVFFLLLQNRARSSKSQPTAAK